MDLIQFAKEFGLPLAILVIGIGAIWRLYIAKDKELSAVEADHKADLRQHAKDMKDAVDQFHISLKQLADDLKRDS